MKARHIILATILIALLFTIAIWANNIVMKRDHIIVIEGHATMSLTLQNSRIMYVDFVED